jgi:hypothetical protein
MRGAALALGLAMAAAAAAQPTEPRQRVGIPPACLPPRPPAAARARDAAHRPPGTDPVRQMTATRTIALRRANCAN